LNYLITGCGGFLGFSLSEKLLKDGHSVFGIDNLISGIPRNIEILEEYPNFTFEKVDITNNDFFINLRFKFDAVINLAAVASPLRYQQIPIQTLLTCVLGTNNLLEFSTRVGAKFIQASTSEVYGDPLISPIPESYVGNVNIHGPRACYDVGKQAAETLCVDFIRVHNTSIQIPRIFNTYGVQQNLGDGRVIPTFIKQALEGEPITVSGDGEQIRSFMHIQDFLDAINSLLLVDNYLGPVNLGNPEPVSMNELARKIRFLSNSESEIIYTSMPVDDPVIRIPDIDKISTVLGWKPKITLDEGLQELISHFNNELR
jgi:nucleoside-diphosphate-sugar epimerase